MKRIEGKVVIVTGAGQGIGYAIAEKFAKEGATVFATGRTLSLTHRTINYAKEWKMVGFSECRWGVRYCDASLL